MGDDKPFKVEAQFRDERDWPCDPPQGWRGTFSGLDHVQVGDNVYILTVHWRVTRREWFAGMGKATLVIVLQPGDGRWQDEARQIEDLDADTAEQQRSND